MSLPKVETVNVVTMDHGRDFAEGWFDGNTNEAFARAEIAKWPERDRDRQARYHDFENDICQRVYDALKEQVAETFVRIANAAIEEERVHPEEPLVPPRVETAAEVTREQGLVFADHMYRQSIDSEDFSVAFGQTQVMTFPSDDVDGEETAAQAHFHELADEIRDRLHDETREFIAEAFARVANDVASRERSRR